MPFKWLDKHEGLFVILSFFAGVLLMFQGLLVSSLHLDNNGIKVTKNHGRPGFICEWRAWPVVEGMIEFFLMPTSSSFSNIGSYFIGLLYWIGIFDESLLHL